MADVSISGLTALGAAPATNDLLVTVDVDDTTQAPTGTTKKMTVANLFTSPTMTGTTAVAAMTATSIAVATTGLMNGNSLNFSSFAGFAKVFGGSSGLSVRTAADNADNFLITDAGAVTIRLTLAVTSDFSVATNKFTVAASTGNTVVAGTLGVTSDFAIATNKFTVAAATGNTVVAGTLTVASTVTLTTGALTVSSGAIQALANSISAGSFVSAIGGKVQLTGTPFTTSISTSPTNCTVSANTAGALALLNGSDGTNRFADLVFYSQSTVTVLASQTLASAPAARAYTCASGALKLAMASGTYNVYAQELQNTTNA